MSLINISYHWINIFDKAVENILEAWDSSDMRLIYKFCGVNGVVDFLLSLFKFKNIIKLFTWIMMQIYLYEVYPKLPNKHIFLCKNIYHYIISIVHNVNTSSFLSLVKIGKLKIKKLLEKLSYFKLLCTHNTTFK